MKVLAMADESTCVAHRKYLRCLMQVLAFFEAPKLPILPISTAVSFNKSAGQKARMKNQIVVFAWMNLR